MENGEIPSEIPSDICKEILQRRISSSNPSGSTLATHLGIPTTVARSIITKILPEKFLLKKILIESLEKFRKKYLEKFSKETLNKLI